MSYAGGTQEECMFTECPELLALIYVVEKMLAHEAVEIRGVRRRVAHSMGERREWAEQVCRAVEPSERIVAVGHRDLYRIDDLVGCLI